MGLNRNACTGYLALTEAAQHYPGHPSNIAAINADLSRLKAPNGLHHYVQSSKRRRHSTDTMDKVNGENAIEIELCVPLCVRHESPTTIAMAGHCRPFFFIFPPTPNSKCLLFLKCRDAQFIDLLRCRLRHPARSCRHSRYIRNCSSRIECGFNYRSHVHPCWYTYTHRK